MPLPDLERTVLRAYGCTLAVDCEPELAATLRAGLPPGYRVAAPAGAVQRTWRLAPGPDGTPSATADDEVVAVDADAAVAMAALVGDLELWVAEHATRRVFLHAGCVVVDGRAIVVPGRTMAGKTTLTAALVRAGATYFSDEYAVVGTDGRVRPYARPLAVRPAGGGRSQPTPVGELGGVAGSGPAPVGLVALLRYDAEAGWAPRPVTQGDAVLGCIDNAVAARRRPAAVLRAVVAATTGAAVVAGTRGDAEGAAAALIDQLVAA